MCRQRVREAAVSPRAASNALRHSRLCASIHLWLNSPVQLAEELVLVRTADGNPLYHTSPSNSTPYPSVIAIHNTQARKGFVSYAIAAMRHFKGRGVVWELW